MKHESKIWGIVAAVVSLVLLYLLLWLVYIDLPMQIEEEGIEVAFGDSEFEGAGVSSTPSEPAPMEAIPAPAPSTQAAPSSNDLIVSEEQTLQLQKRREEEARKKAEAEAARKAKAAEEARIAADKAAAEAKAAAEKAAKDKANNLMGGLFGGSGNGNGGVGTGNQGGSGNSSGNSTKGNPAGKGNSNGYNWSLNGRDLKSPIPTPSYNQNAEGIVVVAIRVDKTGKVVSASKGAGSNTSNQALIDAAIASAKKVTFSAGEGDVLGSITYVFKLH